MNPLKPISRFWFKVYPEFHLFENPQDRKQVARLFNKQNRFRSTIWWICATLISCILSIGYHMYIKHQWPFLLVKNDWLHVPFNSLLVAIVILIAYQRSMHKPLQRYLRQELIKRGIPICLKCGYDLRGQTVPRCPECGQEFDEKLLIKKQEQN